MTAIPEELERRAVVAVVRWRSVSDPAALVEALVRGGVSVIEFTFTGAGTAAAITAVRASGVDVLVGAGTMTTPEHIAEAVSAGAHFGVSPHVDEALVDAARAAGLFYIPGVLTPSELARAQRLGCDMAKLFPAHLTGTGYVRDLLTVFPHARLMVSGGLGPSDVGRYREAGAAVVALGGGLVGGGGASLNHNSITRAARTATERISSSELFSAEAGVQ